MSTPIRNPLVLFDNFFVGNRRIYSWKTKFAVAKAAGFDGFQFAGTRPGTDEWKKALEALPDQGFSLYGYHTSLDAVIDSRADTLEAQVEALRADLQILKQQTFVPFVTVSLDGTNELSGPTIAERGSARAEPRHWERAARIVAALDRAAAETDLEVMLYPHIDWICDTPQSADRILSDAGASHLGVAFCAHHWYANPASVELEAAFELPCMSRLGNAVLTNVIVRPEGMDCVSMTRGEIDMACVLGMLWKHGFKGPISTQGWRIGGDPLLACKDAVDYIRSVEERFRANPDLDPIDR